MKTVDITNENVLTTDVDTIVDISKNEQAQEYYDSWKNHENPNVRIALAKKGLFSELFAKDKECEVRKAVIKTNEKNNCRMVYLLSRSCRYEKSKP